MSQSGRERDPASDKRGFARNVLLSVGFVAVMALLSLANNVILARVTGPAGRGLYSVIVSIIAVGVPVLSLGLGASSTYFVGRGYDTGEVRGLNLINALGVLFLGLAVFGGLVSVAGGLPEVELWRAVAAAALAVPAAVLIDTTRGYALGHKNAFAFNIIQTATISLLLGLNAVTLVWGRDWVLINLVASYWVVALGIVIVTVARAGQLRRPREPFRREAVAYGLRSAGIQLSDAGLLRLDYLVMMPLVGVAATGLYAIADQLTHLMSWVGLVAGKMMHAESSSDEAGDASWAKLELSARLLALTLGLGAIVSAATFWWVIPAVFGPEFHASYIAFLILLPAAYLKSLQALLSTYLAGQGTQDPVVRAGATAVTFDLAAVALGCVMLGWQAAAVARVIAYAIQVGLTFRGVRQVFPGRNLDWVPRRNDLAQVKAWVSTRLKRGSSATQPQPDPAAGTEETAPSED